MATKITFNDTQYWDCCPCPSGVCNPNITLYYARADDSEGGWINFTFTGELNTSSGMDGDGEIYFTGSYMFEGDLYEVLLIWDPIEVIWYINDGGFTFAGALTRDRCDPTGVYELNAFQVSLTPFP